MTRPRYESERWRRQDDDWFTPSGRQANDIERELLNEIFMLRWELETLATQIAKVI